MQTLTFNFKHPVKGVIRFFSSEGSPCQYQRFESDGLSSLKIPVGHLKTGKWKAELDWECEDRLFAIKTEFIVDDLPDNKTL